MLGQLEGSQAVARAVAACRPQVVAAYPISPQTHIVEGLARLVQGGELEGCEYLNVESEFGAMSVCIGASAMGARAYTATASQGLLYMSEAVHNAAGLGLPIVMTVANRAIGAPINIFNDHSDVMALRDCGWIQLHAASNQEAADLHVQAFALAEELSIPVMVCMDGFVLTHAHERLDVPTVEQVDAFLPPFVPRQVLDPAAPITIGAMVGPDAYAEVRALQHRRMLGALGSVSCVAERFAAAFGRDSGGLVRAYRLDDAETVVVGLGSVMGAVEDVVDERRAAGQAVGALTIGCYRPWPRAAVRAALVRCGVERVVVLDRALSLGTEQGPLGADVRLALNDTYISVYDVVAGLGGRPVTSVALRELLARAAIDALEPLSFLGLDEQRVMEEAAR